MKPNHPNVILYPRFDYNIYHIDFNNDQTQFTCRYSFIFANLNSLTGTYLPTPGFRSVTFIIVERNKKPLSHYLAEQLDEFSNNVSNVTRVKCNRKKL